MRPLLLDAEEGRKILTVLVASFEVHDFEGQCRSTQRVACDPQGTRGFFVSFPSFQIRIRRTCRQLRS